MDVSIGEVAMSGLVKNVTLWVLYGMDSIGHGKDWNGTHVPLIPSGVTVQVNVSGRFVSHSTIEDNSPKAETDSNNLGHSC